MTAVTDTGLFCLVTLCRFHQLPVDAAQLAHQYGDVFDDVVIRRAARSLGLRCRPLVVGKAPAQALSRVPLPAIARHRDGSYFILASRQDGRYLIHDVRDARPTLVDLEALLACWNGTLLLFGRRPALAGEAQAFGIRWFVPVLWKYRRLFAEIIAASFFLQLFALVTPLFFQVVMDKVLVHQGLSTLDVLAAGFLLVLLFESLLGAIRSYLLSHTTSRVDVELGAMLYRHLLGLPLAWFQSRPVGHCVARVRELDTIRQFLTGSALTLLLDLAFVLVFILLMLHYSVSLSMVALATVPAYLLLAVLANPLLRARMEEKFRHSARNQAFLVESVSGMGTVKSLALEPAMQRDWEDRLASHISSGFRAQQVGNIAAQAAALINKLMTLGILWWGAQLVMRNDLSVGQLVAFNMLAGRISAPVLKLVQLGQDFQQARIAVERLGDILNLPCEPGMQAGRSHLPALQGRVQFEQVSYRYRPDTPLVLSAVDLHIRPGEVVGIVGKSGSGKSTLTRLIQRLYLPESGRVLVDGVDIAAVDTAWLRRQVGVVLQDSFLFNRSVRDNIAITRPAAAMEDIVQAAQLAGAHEFISGLPEAYDTVIEEQGSNLSGGQRQRIAIARALLNKPRILILDEATSALDYESERIIQDNMAIICQQRTVFIIAHRLSTVRACDRILVLEKGRVVEQGTHEQLLALKGYYARLYQYQSSPARPAVVAVPRTAG